MISKLNTSKIKLDDKSNNESLNNDDKPLPTFQDTNRRFFVEE